MLTLKSPTKVSIPITPTGSVRQLNWVIYMSANDATPTFTGKCTVLPNETKIPLNISDILRDYKCRGEGQIKPRWDNDKFVAPISSGVITNPRHFCNTIKILVYDELQRPIEFTAPIFFEDYEYKTLPTPVESLTTKPLLATPMITTVRPHIPNIITDNYYLGMLVGCTEPTLTLTGVAGASFRSMKINNINRGGYLEYAIPLKALGQIINSDRIEITKEIVAYVDKCPSEYYLCWINNGVWMSWGFNGKTYKSKSYNRTSIVDLDDNKQPITTKVTNSWELNTGYVTRAEFEMIESINTSNWVGMYDVQNDKFTYINITNNSWTNKQNTKNLFEVNVTAEERTLETH